MKEILSNWGVVSSIISVICIVAISIYINKKNSTTLEELEAKCNRKMDEGLARKIFVTKELYENEIKHIDNTLNELKEQNNKILEYVRK